MGTYFESVCEKLKDSPQTWLVTGAAGFIGSNLVETLLQLNQSVVGLDNFATGYKENLEDVRKAVGEALWKRFSFIEGDITDFSVCAKVCKGVTYVLHQAALGSVPRSIAEPLQSHRANVDGFVSMLLAAKEANVKRFVYASSSAVYGDSEELPKVETNIGEPLSPYAATKLIDEIYAKNFSRVYGLETIGLRYFNVFGPRQDPEGAYAAVIPRWIAKLVRGEVCEINGDGETSRDFCYISNVVQANILSAVATETKAFNQVFNIALSERTTLNELYNSIQTEVAKKNQKASDLKPSYMPFREGDIRHSHADIAAAKKMLSYDPAVKIKEGISKTVQWFLSRV